MSPPVRRHRADPEHAVAAPALILAGRALVAGRLQPVEIVIDDDGRIASIGRTRSGAPRHDVGEGVILPAAGDVHVHFRDPPGPPGVESFATGTVAAAVGGVGLVGDMPNTEPPVTSAERAREKSRRIAGRAAVDVVLYGAPSSAADPGALARVVGALKVFLSPTTGIDEVPAADAIPALLDRLAPTGLPVAVHAEDPSRFRDGSPVTTPADWNARRPPSAELAAIDRLASAPAALRLHVAHLTTPASVARVRALGISGEATPHHLLLSERSGTGGRFKVNPPLRSEADRAGLWEAFRQGAIPLLASDHAPHAIAEKDAAFDRAPSGVPGVETMLPLLLARVRDGDLDLGTLLRAACDRPARWMGQPMGRLAPGHRAHLLVVDFRARTTISAERLHSASGWSPFEGWTAIFPREHYRDGVRIVEEYEYVGSPTGRVVRPEFVGPAPSR